MALYHRIQSLDDSVNPLPAALLSNLCALPWLRPAGKESPSPGWDKSHRLDLHGRGFANLSSTCFLPVWGGGGQRKPSAIWSHNLWDGEALGNPHLPARPIGFFVACFSLL